MSSFGFNFVEGLASPILRFAVRVFQVLLVIMTMTMFSCQRNYTPKPHAYFRIDFPEKGYQMYDSISYPFIFEYPVYGKLVHLTPPSSDSCWMNIIFPKYRGTIHLTYKKIDHDFDQHIENNWKIIFTGIAQKADAVDYHPHVDPEMKVFGTLFDIKGNAASAIQFFVTDSTRNFLRGSLYFSVRPNQDSLAPVVAFFRKDIIHLMESIRWKELKIKK